MGSRGRPARPGAGELKTALVVGSADTLTSDLARLDGWEPDCVVGVNDGGWLYPGRLDHWVTLHWERMPEWIARRADSGYETWTRDTRNLARSELRPDWLLPHWGTGTSGLYGVTVATHLKADRVVLAGVPLTATPYEAGAGTWEGAWPETEVVIHRDGWTYWHKHGRLDHVRSCSGWTAELLGDPFAAGWI